MKPWIFLGLILGTHCAARAEVSSAAEAADFETLSAATQREIPGVSLQISLEKPRFEMGEPIAVVFNYRNESAAAVSFTRSGTSYSPIRVVKREFRARQLDGDVVLQSNTPNLGIISEMVVEETLAPHQSVRETVFLNERFFLARAGRYQLTAWSSAVVTNHQRKWLQSAPVELQIVPASEAFKTRVLAEAKSQIEAARAIAAGRSLGSYPHELSTASYAAKRLGWLRDERAIPILVAALEIGNSYQFDAQNALRFYPRAAVKAALGKRLEEAAPITSSRNLWLELGADSPAEKEKLGAQIDAGLRAALQTATDPQKRGFLATIGLVDSPDLRRDPQFWHEALVNLGHDDQNLGFEIHTLLTGFHSEKISANDFPIQTVDLKTALESEAPFQVRMTLFKALETRDPAYLRQFLLARVDNISFDYPRGAFEAFSDAQIKPVAAKLLAAIRAADDDAWRDDYGRRLRDLALRGATIAQLEQTESWLLQNAPAADAPILDAIQLLMPSKTWFWLQQSLAKRPLESPYDNRMRVLVLQQSPSARQIVRGLLGNGSEERRIEVLNAINSAATEPFGEESQRRWQSGEQFFPGAAATSFDDLQRDISAQITPEAVKQAATRAGDAIMAHKKRADLQK